MSRVVLFSGGGDYVDPWHPFVETSAVLADILRDEGFSVDSVLTVDELAERSSGADLLVVNAGGGPQAHPRDADLRAAVDGHTGGLLALHVASTLLPEHDLWEERLGGRWVRGHSMHPERGSMRLVRAAEAAAGDLPALIDTVDEAYSWLRVADETRVLYRQDHAGEAHPVVWVRESDGVRSAYSALGHDVEAYDSPLVRALVAQLARWASTRIAH
ncbi:ThuA domain-containing protein [Microbacterium sp. S1037]|uniref:ThuA domain-containing protein n=1 Tax=Microbacterium sp. S1037 TaxID=3398227 RepID=UPI003AAFEB02